MGSEPPNRLSWCTIAMKSKPAESIVPRIAPAGFDGIELWGPHIENYEERHGTIDGLVSLLTEFGLAVPAIAVYFDVLSDDSMSASIERCRRYVSYAQQFSCSILRAWIAPLGSGQMSREQWTTTVERTRLLVETCSSVSDRVTLAVETHADQPMDSVPSTERLLSDTGMGLAVVYDVYNLYRIGQAPEDVLSVLGPDIVHVHAKNGWLEAGAFVPSQLKSGEMDWSAIVDALNGHGYKGWISVEYFGGGDVVASAVDDRRFLREVIDAARTQTAK